MGDSKVRADASLKVVGQQLSAALVESTRLVDAIRQRTGQIRSEGAGLREQAAQLRSQFHVREPEVVAGGLDSARCSDRLAGLVHDLKSPMIGADKTLTHLLEKLGDQLSSEDAYLLALLKESNQRLLQTVNNFLAAVRYEEGSVPHHFEPVRLVPLIHACLEEMSLLARSKGVVLIFATVYVNIEIQADEQALRSLLTNLLSNAIKFAGEDGTVVISLQSTAETVEMKICDSGPGVPQEDLPMLFQRFWQSEGSRTKSFGTGLGLYLCRQIVEHLGGQISYERDSCTTFSVILPLSSADSAEIYDLPCAKAEAV